MYVRISFSLAMAGRRRERERNDAHWGFSKIANYGKLASFSTCTYSAFEIILSTYYFHALAPW